MVDELPRKLLLLDLDETLYFASETRLDRAEDFILDRYFVYLRPHLQPFLSFCLSAFDVAIWTAATEDYAQAMVAKLFGSAATVAFVWSRARCGYRLSYESQQEYWLKDLKKLSRQGYDLRQVIAVDDTPLNFKRSYGNLVTVKRYKGQADDNELELLTKFLERLRLEPNVRAVEKRNWRAMVEHENCPSMAQSNA